MIFFVSLGRFESGTLQVNKCLLNRLALICLFESRAKRHFMDFTFLQRMPFVDDTTLSIQHLAHVYTQHIVEYVSINCIC